MGEDMEIHLLNPITRRRIRLPSQLSFHDFGRGDSNDNLHGFESRRELRDLFIDKAVIVGSPCSAGGCMVVAIVFPGDGSRVVVVRPGLDKLWTVLMSERYIISDIIHRKGLLYGVSYGSIPQLFVWDMNNIAHASLQKMMMIPMTVPSPAPIIYQDCFYLVEVFGELVGVRRIHEYSTGVDDNDDPWEENEGTTYYTSRIFVFEAKKVRWVEVKDLGDCCLFLGDNTSTVISPVPSGFRRNRTDN